MRHEEGGRRDDKGVGWGEKGGGNSVSGGLKTKLWIGPNSGQTKIV